MVDNWWGREDSWDLWMAGKISSSVLEWQCSEMFRGFSVIRGKFWWMLTFRRAEWYKQLNKPSWTPPVWNMSPRFSPLSYFSAMNWCKCLFALYPSEIGVVVRIFCRDGETSQAAYNRHMVMFGTGSCVDKNDPVIGDVQGWVFPVMWTTLYTLMGIAAWLVWKEGG